MTLEELKAIREKLDKVFATPDEEDLCLICTSQMHFDADTDPASTCYSCAQAMVEDDMPKLLNEVERLQSEMAKDRDLLKELILEKAKEYSDAEDE